MRHFPIPNITDVLDSLGKSKYFSTIDCANGFWQIPVREEDRPKTAFNTEYGHFECKSMPFGLKGAILSQGQIGQDLPLLMQEEHLIRQKGTISLLRKNYSL